MTPSSSCASKIKWRSASWRRFRRPMSQTNLSSLPTCLANTSVSDSGTAVFCLAIMYLVIASKASPPPEVAAGAASVLRRFLLGVAAGVTACLSSGSVVGDAARGGILLVNGPAALVDGPAPLVDGPAPLVDGPAPLVDGPAPLVDDPEGCSCEAVESNAQPYNTFMRSRLVCKSRTVESPVAEYSSLSGVLSRTSINYEGNCSICHASVYFARFIKIGI